MIFPRKRTIHGIRFDLVQYLFSLLSICLHTIPVVERPRFPVYIIYSVESCYSKRQTYLYWILGKTRLTRKVYNNKLYHILLTTLRIIIIGIFPRVGVFLHFNEFLTGLFAIYQNMKQEYLSNSHYKMFMFYQ